jgi:hypothetical protein
MNRYSVEISDTPHFERRRLEKKQREKPVADSRLIHHPAPYSQPARPISAAPMIPVQVVWVPVMAIPQWVQPSHNADTSGWFFLGALSGGFIAGLAAIFLAVIH